MKTALVSELDRLLTCSYTPMDCIRLVLAVRGGTFRRGETLRDLLFSCNLSQLQEIFERTQNFSKVSAQFDRHA